jgi:hypothetical protein
MSTNAQEQFANELKSKLGEEGMQRLSECKTKEEVMQAISDAGVELPDEMLEGISGGGDWIWEWDCWKTVPAIWDKIF